MTPDRPESELPELTIPSEHLKTPASAFGWLLEQCYGGRIQDLCSAIPASRQTLWSWRNPPDGAAGGVPPGHRARIKELIEDPAQPLRLASNMRFEDILRPVAQRVKVEEGRRNIALLDLITTIVQHENDPEIEGMGLALLEEIVRLHLPANSTPHMLWMWGYVTGGIPQTYVPAMYEAMSSRGQIWAALGTDRDTFRRYFLTRLVADPDSQQVQALLAQLDEELAAKAGRTSRTPPKEDDP